MRNLTLLILLALLITACNGDEETGNQGEQRKTYMNGVEVATGNLSKTPAGMNVFSNQELGTTIVRLMDEGARQAVAAADESGYAKTDHLIPITTIWTPKEPCEKSPKQGVWSFKVRTRAYCGTVFDPDCRGWVYAAEMVMQFGNGQAWRTCGFEPDGVTAKLCPMPPAQKMIVCPNPEVVKDGTRFGFEHSLIANEPRENAYFNATIIHGPPHPLLPHQIPESLKGDEGKLPRVIRGQNDSVYNVFVPPAGDQLGESTAKQGVARVVD